VAIRLKSAARIVDGGFIRYFCWGSPAHCPECTGSPASYFACSSFLGRYLICLGDGFWRAWAIGDLDTTATTLLHEALHIFFGRTVSDVGSTGNANCYERYLIQFNRLFLHPATAASCPINLHNGSRGLHVREAQRRLNAWITATPAAGLARLRVDGVFAAGTEAAVRAFQAAVGLLPADGVIGARTWSRLPRTPGKTLHRGDRDPDVNELQHKLNMWSRTVTGGRRLAVDGNFGAATEAVVRAFQTANGLPANGTVNALTWAQLPQF
jgi:hypothetical protein